MTTPQPAALPELPHTTYSLFYEQPGDLEDEGYQYVLDEPGYTADQMRAYALATLQAQPAAEVSDELILKTLRPDVWMHVEGHHREQMLADARAILALRPQAVPMTDEPEWIVNDLGELGVRVGSRFFFLYKGDSIEYGTDGIRDSRDGVALHDDGTPMHYRIVGKREFGETCWPLQWVIRGHSESRYTEPLTFIPGLSWGKPEDGEWKPLPAHHGITAPAGGEVE